MIIKAITLWQPYANAVLMGLKKYETRSWATKYRGPIVLHSSVRPLDKYARDLADKYNMKELLFGKVILICELQDCILMTPEFISNQSIKETDFGDWKPGRYAWKLGNIKAIPEPISISGRQGFWNFDIDSELFDLIQNT